LQFLSHMLDEGSTSKTQGCPGRRRRQDGHLEGRERPARRDRRAPGPGAAGRRGPRRPRRR
jgi:hypothetical protein